MKLARGHLYFADKEGHVTKAKLKSDLVAKQNLTETVLIRIAPADRELLDAVTAAHKFAKPATIAREALRRGLASLQAEIRR